MFAHGRLEEWVQRRVQRRIRGAQFGIAVCEVAPDDVFAFFSIAAHCHLEKWIQRPRVRGILQVCCGDGACFFPAPRCCM